MKLDFVWIKEFKNITEQGFRLTSEFLISYNKISEELVITETKSYIPNFFGQNLLSVTGIIGANGSGKTNFLDFLKFRLASFLESSWTVFEGGLEAVFVFEKTIYCHKNIQLENSESLKQNGYLIFFYEKSLNEIYLARDSETHEYGLENVVLQNSHIFYSNIFDLKSEYNFENLLNISTNALVFNDKYNSPVYRSFELERKDSFESLTAYRINEIRRQFDFIINKELDLPFKLPQRLTIRIEEEHNKYLNKAPEWYEQNNLKFLFDFKWYFFHSFDTDSKDQQEYKKIFKSIFLYKLIKVLSVDEPEKFNSLSLEDLYQFVYDEDWKVIEKLELSGDQQKSLPHFFKSFNNLLENANVKVVENSFDRIENFWEKYDMLQLDLAQETEDILFDFLSNFNFLVGSKTFLAFNWEGFSSGELNLLTLFARFNSIASDEKIVAAKHLIIMIDEGETYFHPAWQRDYIKIVITYLKNLFKEKTFQIIIASNSPFIVSDLPKSMLNFLNRDEAGKCIVVDGLNTETQTFGANIHSLYSEAFFMQNTLIGSFAKDKLDKLIKIINKENQLDEEFPTWDVVRAYINIIGEPVLKSLLQKKLDRIAKDSIV